jgi:hypothetical protein
LENKGRKRGKPLGILHPAKADIKKPSREEDTTGRFLIRRPANQRRIKIKTPAAMATIATIIATIVEFNAGTRARTPVAISQIASKSVPRSRALMAASS